MKKKNTVLFPIGDKEIRSEYPELAAVEEFKKLSNQEMLFVWHFANRTSKLHGLAPRERVIKCLDILKQDLSAQSLQQYSQLEFPDHLKAAIERMEKYNPEIRNQAKTIIETIFDNINGIVNADLSKMDMEDKQKYVSLSMNIAKNMSDMVAQIEQGYGIREQKNKNESKEDPINENIWDGTAESDS